MGHWRTLPYGPIDLDKLSEFERELPAPLPDAFRRCLVDWNGGKFSRDGGRSLRAMHELFGLHDGPQELRLDWTLEASKTSVPRGLLVFANDGWGNYFGLSLVERNHGAVYLIDNEEFPASWETLDRIAESFSEFLELHGASVVAPAEPATIQEAIDCGDVDALHRLLAAGRSAEGAVHRAVNHGDARLLMAVLQAGGDPDERGAIGGTETPLFVAARTNRPDLVEMLLAHGADPNLRCGAGGTALEMAQPWPRVYEILVRAGAR